MHICISKLSCFSEKETRAISLFSQLTCPGCYKVVKWYAWTPPSPTTTNLTTPDSKLKCRLSHSLHNLERATAISWYKSPQRAKEMKFKGGRFRKTNTPMTAAINFSFLDIPTNNPDTWSEQRSCCTYTSPIIIPLSPPSTPFTSSTN